MSHKVRLVVALCVGCVLVSIEPALAQAKVSTGPGGQLHGCVSSKGVLSVIGFRSKCPRRTMSIKFGATGTTGATGATGATGQQGPAGTPANVSTVTSLQSQVTSLQSQVSNLNTEVGALQGCRGRKACRDQLAVVRIFALNQAGNELDVANTEQYLLFIVCYFHITLKIAHNAQQILHRRNRHQQFDVFAVAD